MTQKIPPDDFRSRIREIATNNKSPHLRDIELLCLGYMDEVLFQRFEKGRLTLADIEVQERVLAGLYDEQRIKASKKLLAYMRSELLKKGGI